MSVETLSADRSLGRSATHRVLGLTLIGLLAGGLLLIVDEYLRRHIVTNHRNLVEFQERTSRAIDTLDTAVTSAQGELWRLLNESTEEDGVHSGVDSKALFDEGRRAIGLLDGDIEQVHRLLNELEDLEPRAIAWRTTWNLHQRRFNASFRALEASIDQLASRARELEMRQYRDRAQDLVMFRRLKGEDARDFAVALTSRSLDRSDYGAIRDELFELTLLTRQIVAEKDVGVLDDLKNNQLAPSLEHLHTLVLRADAAAVRPEASLQIIDEGLVNGIEVALFGTEFELKSGNRRNESASDGLFRELERLLRQDRQLESILASVAQQEQAYARARASLVDGAKNQVAAVSASIENVIERARFRTLPIITLAALAFLVLARLVARTLRQQVDNLEGAHLEASGALEEIKLTQRAIPAVLIGLDPALRIVSWNRFARRLFRVENDRAIGNSLGQLAVEWDSNQVEDALWECAHSRKGTSIPMLHYRVGKDPQGTLEFHINPKLGSDGRLLGILLVGLDVQERIEMESQLAQARKLESIGQLAAGIAHEINTPTQYATDNARFLGDASQDLLDVVHSIDRALGDVVGEVLLSSEDVATMRAQLEQADMEFLLEEVPKSVEQCLGGLGNVAEIVRAMKEFSHPASAEKSDVDLNQSIENTLTVTRNEWKYLADLELKLDPMLPLVPCLQGEFNQVILNLVVNAAHAIADHQDESHPMKGTIEIETTRSGDWAEIVIRDNGCGMSEAVCARAFDPFFTTKDVGRGSGQGLAIARSTIVDKHQGTIGVESRPGQGSTFSIRLPLGSGAEERAAGAA